MWTEQNVLKIDVEVVVCDVEQFSVPSVKSCKVLCIYVDTVRGVWHLSILFIFCILVSNNSNVPNPCQNLITPYSRVLLQKITGFQLIKKFPTFYGTWRFIAAFIILHDTTANINENWTLYHKAAIELLWVLVKKVLELLINWWLLAQSKAESLKNTLCCQAPGICHWLACSAATDCGRYGRILPGQPG